ncbi:MAG: hypothetical protein WCI67_19265 [Chloroflexales bacterium]
MSAHSLAIFLQRLREGALDPVGPVCDSATLARLVAQPAPQLQALLGAQVDALLTGWPRGAALRPRSIPSVALWTAAALNNLAWAADRPDPRLLVMTLRLAQAIPAATDPETALAYHSLSQHLSELSLAADDWLHVSHLLIAQSPLTAAWLPRLDDQLNWALLHDLLRQPTIQAALRDRWLSLLPNQAMLRHSIPATCAKANVELGRLLGALLECGGEWRPLVLAVYEADCALQRRGSPERPEWPLIAQLSAARSSADPLQRRRAEQVLSRYRPLLGLMEEPATVRPYLSLDGRFLTMIADALPAARLRLRRVED